MTLSDENKEKLRIFYGTIGVDPPDLNVDAATAIVDALCAAGEAIAEQDETIDALTSDDEEPDA